MFGFKSKQDVQAQSPHAGLVIVFHKEARHFGEHGKIRVSHKRQNIDDEIVTFAFPDLATPPNLDPFLINYIWEEAKAQGYIPHNLIEYGRTAEVVNFNATPNAIPVDVARALIGNLQAHFGGEVEEISRLLGVKMQDIGIIPVPVLEAQREAMVKLHAISEQLVERERT